METTTQTSTGTQAAIKLLSIIGFFALLGLGVWLVVQGVRLFPSAFSSLASIAETVGGYRPNAEFVITLEKNIVNSGEMFTIRWNDMGGGTYTFAPQCSLGTVVSVRTSEGDLREISCSESLTLPSDATGLFLSIRSGEQRFSDVPFTVTYDPEKGDAHVAESRVTVVNATVPTRPEVTVTPVEPTIVVVSKPAPVVTESVKPAPITPVTKPTAKPTQPAASVVSILPTSFPNGFTDLKISYLGVGTMVNGVFVPQATFNPNETAALRFEVKNIGTKTSADWTYALALPEGLTYTSETQTPLTPNERAIFTVSFELGDTKTASVAIGGTVATKNDTDTKNNTFTWSVKIK